MSETKVTCSQCSAEVDREDIRTGTAIATKSVAFCPTCAKALTDEELNDLIPASKASANAAGTKDKPGPESMAIRNVVAQRLAPQRESHVGTILIGVGIALALVLILVLAASM
jgi:endogenous inhibitor of DNA gyrase (YacG/DUF329 family)